MSIKLVIRITAFMLAIVFSGQLIVESVPTEKGQIAMDIDGDHEKKESEDERETDKLNHHQFNSGLESDLNNFLISIHYSQWWVSPTIETHSPPPEAV